MLFDHSHIKRIVIVVLLCSSFQFIGCSRTRYRLNADQDAHCVLREKTNGAPWSPPFDYSIYPQPGSRLHDPSPVDDPCLPVPAPQLYDYQLPELPEHDEARLLPKQNRDDDQEVSSDARNEEAAPDNSTSNTAPTSSTTSTTPNQSVGETTNEPAVPNDVAPEAGTPNASDSIPREDNLTPEFNQPSVAPAEIAPPIPKDFGVQTTGSLPSGGTELATVSFQGSADEPVVEKDSGVRLIPIDDPEPEGDEVETSLDDLNEDSPNEDEPAVEDNEREVNSDGESFMGNAPIPVSYWESVPQDCLRRMLEFDSVTDEYTKSFQREPRKADLDDSPRLALEDIIFLTLLNSRELQTAKETLYRTALGLTLERFDYQLKPSVGNNGSAVDFDHNRSGGETVNTLRIPTTLQLDRALWTGGDLLARFANSVLLTFNGPQGFAADVSSELLFDISQSLLQRDIRLEALTQAERDVVYAARDFARFRKQLFVQLASQYYSLIRQFRQIEIESQNYFTLVRNFSQGQAEFRAGRTSRIQLDQVEQQVISGRRGLLSSCTGLENSLDDLKIRIGLPTEQLINLDLTELNLLTLRDEVAVNAELIERSRIRLTSELRAETPARATLLSSAVVLVDRMVESIRLREKLGEETPDLAPYREAALRLQIEASRLDIGEANKELQTELQGESPRQTLVFQRQMDVVEETLRLIRIQLEYAIHSEADEQQIADFQRRHRELQRRAFQLSGQFDKALAAEAEELDRLLQESNRLQTEVERLVREIDVAFEIGRTELTPKEELERSIRQAEELISESDDFLLPSSGGLVPVEISMDDAMMTALVQRFDLMNERGNLADSWRQIKYAADDLRSVLNLRATQSIRTRSNENRPFDFTFDDSTTSLSATFDAPLNRRAQRNAYRASLINYQAAMRRLTQLEDDTKLSIRRDLRSLSLDREQYVNDIASAALAYERVVSTGLEIRFNVGSVAARDFLEAQNAYINALSNVASRHIDYITGRLQLFLDLESLTVGDDGFWDQLYIEEHQPQPVHQLPDYALPAYGRLHPCLRYSCEIRRMQCVPTGVSMIHREPVDDIRSTLNLDGLDEQLELEPPVPQEIDGQLAP